MLSEEALVLLAATAALALLVLGVLELLAPTRPRHPRRGPVRRDPRRRARARPAPVPRARDQAANAVFPPAPLPEPLEPPIEEWLRSQAEVPPQPAAPRPAPARPAPPPPLPPTRPRGEFAWPRPRRPGQEEGARPPVAERHADRAIPAGSAAPAQAPRAAWPPVPTVNPITASPEPAPPLALPAQEESNAPEEPIAGAGAPVAALEPVAEPEPVAAPEPSTVSEPMPVSEPIAAPEPLSERYPERIAEPGPASEEEPAGPASPVERCYQLYEAKQFADVVAVATAALEGSSRDAQALKPHEVARLWGVVGLARREGGDHEGARAAFEEALAGASRRERESWERQLASLALLAGRELLGRAESTGLGDGEERVTQVYSAIAWFERGLAVAADDEPLRTAAAAARAALWPTYEEVAGELIQRQDYTGARRLLRQALGDPHCPADLQATFRDLLSGTYGGEVGQLTAEALRRMQDGKEAEALATLERAEELLAATPEEGLTERRRQELERRLWWSYTKVGIRRLEGGLPESALEPLLRALRFASVGTGRLEETRHPLVRALEGVVEARATLIERLAADGDRTEAAAHCEQLWEIVEDTLARGMTREELAPALSRVEALFDRLEGPEA